MWPRFPHPTHTHPTRTVVLLSILGIAAVAELIMYGLETDSQELVSVVQRRMLRSLGEMPRSAAVRDFNALEVLRHNPLTPEALDNSGVHLTYMDFINR